MKCPECGQTLKHIRGSIYECENSECLLLRVSIKASWATLDSLGKAGLRHWYPIQKSDCCFQCGQPLPKHEKSKNPRILRGK